MKQLSKEFIGIGTVRGFVFTQLKATNKAFLYKINDKGKIHYEVFKKRINERFGNVSYPSTKAFGVWAWCIRDYQQAITKFNELTGREAMEIKRSPSSTGQGINKLRIHKDTKKVTCHSLLYLVISYLSNNFSFNLR